MKQHKGTEFTVAAMLRAAQPEADPLEPPVTATESRMHGGLAGTVGLLRQAARSTETAHALACKHRRDHPVIAGDLINEVQLAALDQAVEDTWKSMLATREAFQHVGAIPPHLFRG